MKEIKFRMWDGERFVFRGLHDKNWYTESKAGKCVTGAHQSDCKMQVMQFTGLVDMHGVEIYDGDIVKWGHVDGYVELSGVRVAIVDMSVGSDGLTFNANKPITHRFKIGQFAYAKCIDKCMEVIGNIHQDPNLLR